MRCERHPRPMTAPRPRRHRPSEHGREGGGKGGGEGCGFVLRGCSRAQTAPDFLWFSCGHASLCMLPEGHGHVQTIIDTTQKSKWRKGGPGSQALSFTSSRGPIVPKTLLSSTTWASHQGNDCDGSLGGR